MADSYITEYLKLPKTIQLPVDTEINNELIKTLIEIHDNNLERYKILQGYYEGKAKIQDRTKDSHKSNNKLTLDYPSYIVDILLGMFVGKPITYTTDEKNEEILTEINSIYDYNDEQDENTELAKLMGVKGRAYEIVYLDEENNLRFNEVDPENIIFVYDDNINPSPLMALYIRDLISLENLTSDEPLKAVTVYTPSTVYEFEQEGSDYKLIEDYMNVFQDVNVIEFLNNDEGIGDFERVLTLIDEMNLLQSDTANDFEEFTNAILILYGMLNADNDDVQQLIEDGVLLADKIENGSQGAEWLIKDINDTALKNYKDGLDNLIHKFAKVPNMSDESFAGNVSGESMKYKLFATDQIISQKQRKFKTALVRRLELIFNLLNLKTVSDEEKGADYKVIEIHFNDNKPFNELDNVRMVKELLSTGASKSHAFSRLRGLENVQAELDRQAEEASAYSDIFKEVDDEELQGFAEEQSETD